MRIETITVTPDLAEMFLSKNSGNRRMRATHVEAFCRELRQGTFKTTHQGIAISKTGILLDGQHRLAAIKQTGISALMVIAWDCDAETAVDWPVDFGIGRSASDVMGFTQDEASCVDFCLKLYLRCTRRFSTNERRHTYQCINGLHNKLFQWCATKRRLLSRTAIRVPAMLRLVDNNTYSAEQYRALVLQDYAAMSPAVQGFNKRITTAASSMDNNDSHLAARAWIAFDVERSNALRQQVNDSSIQLLEMQEVLDKLGMAAIKTIK